MNNISVYDFLKNIRAWNVAEIKKLVAEIQAQKAKYSNRVFPSLNSIIEALYAHFSECSTDKNFAENYWQTLPDEAYKILKILQPFCRFSDNQHLAHKHFLYEPIMRGDLRMLKYLWKNHCQKHSCPEINKLLYLGILDFCYMRLPSWEGFPGYKDESRRITTKAFSLDLHSPDLLKTLYSQAVRCNIPGPEHLDFLMKHGAFINTPENILVLSECSPRLELMFYHVPDYEADLGRIWKIRDCHITHKYQDPECLVNSCITSGEYWSLTCECGVPACANVDKPVLSMRFCNTARWRITMSDDDQNPDVYYLTIPIKQYLQDFDDLLKMIEGNIHDVSDTYENDDTWIPDEYDRFSSTCNGLTKVRRIRHQIQKELQRK